MEKAVAEADGALESIQGLRCHPVLHRHVVVAVVRGEGLLVDGGALLTGVLQLADVAVALIVHFPRLPKDPAALDIRCERRQETRNV